MNNGLVSVSVVSLVMLDLREQLTIREAVYIVQDLLTISDGIVPGTTSLSIIRAPQTDDSQDTIQADTVFPISLF